jgi:hypothetical protein
MSHETMSAEPNIGKRPTLTLVLVVISLFAAACGGTQVAQSATTAESPLEPTSNVEIITEAPSDVGSDPFVAVLTVDISTEPETVVAIEQAADRFEPGQEVPASTPGLYGGSGELAVCDSGGLVAFLAGNSPKAAAWAEVLDINVEDIGTYVADLDEVILLHDTRVTNHGFRDGSPYSLQSVLQAGTAVLIDNQGVPRVRCACGNPLLAPEKTEGTPNPGIEITPDRQEVPPGDTETTTEQIPTDSFCAIWTRVGPIVSGGPDSAEDIVAYIAASAEAFGSLVAAAEATPGFPADALADLTAYRDALEEAVEIGPSAVGDTALRDRVEEFLSSYCDETAVDDVISDDELTHVPTDDDIVSDGNCGSMQFFLLIAAAEGLGLDHTATSQPYLDAFDALADGWDPGDTVDLGDFTVALDFEEVGCLGAQAMQDLFAANGLLEFLDESLL